MDTPSEAAGSANRFGDLSHELIKEIPFYTTAFEQENKQSIPKEMFEHYEVIDVVGDGNCGPYAFHLGILNTMSKKKIEKNIQTLFSQSKYVETVTSLRRKIRNAFSTKFINANKKRLSFIHFGFGDPDWLESDKNAIFVDNFNYFEDGCLDQDYQFPKDLSCLGLSIFQKIRVVVIHAQGGSGKVATTTIFDNRPQKSRIKKLWYRGKIYCYDGLYKIPDDEFDPTDTVEILFLSSFDTSLGHHFLWLKRNRKMTPDEVKHFKSLPSNEISNDATQNENDIPNKLGKKRKIVTMMGTQNNQAEKNLDLTSNLDQTLMQLWPTKNLKMPISSQLPTHNLRIPISLQILMNPQLKKSTTNLQQHRVNHQLKQHNKIRKRKRECPLRMSWEMQSEVQGRQVRES